MRRLDRKAGTALGITGVFLAGAVAIFGYLLTGTGIRIPLLQAEPYTASVDVADVDNLVTVGKVRIAGVQVGEVEEVTPLDGSRARVVFSVDPAAAPLHEGAGVRIGERSLVGETALEITDGSGPQLASGSQLPDEAVQASTQLRDLLASVDEPTRASMSTALDSLGAGTQGAHGDVSAVLAGLGKLGREGHTATDAIAAQSEDLKALVAETGTLMQTLDAQEGQIASMVSDADRLTKATADQRQSIEDTMRRLPGVLTTAGSATAALTDVAHSLAPVAADLNAAAPGLDEALRQLPDTTRDVRGLLPALDGALDAAPPTLDRVPTLGEDVRSLSPVAVDMLREVNPMLNYLAPYGRDFAAFIANFNSVIGHTDEAGFHYLRLQPRINERSIQSPVNFGINTYENPYPAPGAGLDVGPFEGEYPRVERAPR
ncbi:MlaD family protein [Pseudonocardia sp. RS010]|uniref:MlaD family protein n=1 Tax=Pseudonocardia sp. RS010 TaxID=3385979 RepID=UPI0039A1BC88